MGLVIDLPEQLPEELREGLARIRAWAELPENYRLQSHMRQTPPLLPGEGGQFQSRGGWRCVLSIDEFEEGQFARHLSCSHMCGLQPSHRAMYGIARELGFDVDQTDFGTVEVEPDHIIHAIGPIEEALAPVAAVAVMG